MSFVKLSAGRSQDNNNTAIEDIPRPSEERMALRDSDPAPRLCLFPRRVDY